MVARRGARRRRPAARRPGGRAFSRRGIGARGRTRYGRIGAAPDTEVLGTARSPNARVPPANGAAGPPPIDAGETPASGRRAVPKTRRSQEGRWASTSGRESVGVKWPRYGGEAPGLLSTERSAVASLPRPEAREEESPGAPLHRAARRPFRSLPLRAPARRLLSGPPAPRRAGRRRGRREERGRPGGAPGDRRPRTPLRRPGARRRR